VLFVVLGGLFPNATVIEHSSEVDVVDEAICTFNNLNRGTGYSDNNSSMPCPDSKPKHDVNRRTGS